MEEAAEKALKEVRAGADKRLQEVKEGAGRKQEEIDSAGNQRMEKLEQRITQHETSLQEQKERLDAAITKHQQQFADAQEKRLAEYADTQATRKKEFDKLFDTSKSKVEALSSELKGAADSILESMKNDEAEVRKLKGVIGTTGLTAGFKEAADKENRSANIWRGMAVAGILGVIAVAVWTIVSTAAGEADWYGFARRVFLTAAVGWLAGYSIKESARHRKREERNRRLELELASIDPYLANLEPEAQHKIKDELVKRWFAQPIELDTGHGSGKVVSVDRALKWIERVLSQIGR